MNNNVNGVSAVQSQGQQQPLANGNGRVVTATAEGGHTVVYDVSPNPPGAGEEGMTESLLAAEEDDKDQKKDFQAIWGGESIKLMIAFLLKHNLMRPPPEMVLITVVVVVHWRGNDSVSGPASLEMYAV